MYIWAFVCVCVLQLCRSKGWCWYVCIPLGIYELLFLMGEWRRVHFLIRLPLILIHSWHISCSVFLSEKLILSAAIYRMPDKCPLLTLACVQCETWVCHTGWRVRSLFKKGQCEIIIQKRAVWNLNRTPVVFKKKTGRVHANSRHFSELQFGPKQKNKLGCVGRGESQTRSQSYPNFQYQDSSKLRNKYSLTLMMPLWLPHIVCTPLALMHQCWKVE